MMHILAILCAIALGVYIIRGLFAIIAWAAAFRLIAMFRKKTPPLAALPNNFKGNISWGEDNKK